MYVSTRTRRAMKRREWIGLSKGNERLSPHPHWYLSVASTVWQPHTIVIAAAANIQVVRWTCLEMVVFRGDLAYVGEIECARGGDRVVEE